MRAGTGSPVRDRAGRRRAAEDGKAARPLRAAMLSVFLAGLTSCAGQPSERVVDARRTETRVVAADRSSRLYTFVHFRGASCDPQPNFIVSVVSPPAHGRISTPPGTVVPHEHTSAQHAACTVPTQGLQVRYTPEPGYSGPDSVVVSDGLSVVTFNLDVRSAAQ